MSDEVERTLCQLPSVHVFRIPARTSAEGYRAADWPKDPNWTGKLKIVAKSAKMAIILSDAANNTFAVCHVSDDSCVERTLDSGRYFVLKITNAQGRHAFIGVAFNERSDAFDFNVALSNFKSEVEREEKMSSHSSSLTPDITDFSLKSGEKIKIKLNTKKQDKSEENDNPLRIPTMVTHSKVAPSRDPFTSDFSDFSSDSTSYSDPFSS